MKRNAITILVYFSKTFVVNKVTRMDIDYDLLVKQDSTPPVFLAEIFKEEEIKASKAWLKIRLIVRCKTTSKILKTYSSIEECGSDTIDAVNYFTQIQVYQDDKIFEPCDEALGRWHEKLCNNPNVAWTWDSSFIDYCFVLVIRPSPSVNKTLNLLKNDIIHNTVGKRDNFWSFKEYLCKNFYNVEIYCKDKESLMPERKDLELLKKKGFCFDIMLKGPKVNSIHSLLKDISKDFEYFMGSNNYQNKHITVDETSMDELGSALKKFLNSVKNQ